MATSDNDTGSKTFAAAFADYDVDGDLDLIEGTNGANGVYFNDGSGEIWRDRPHCDAQT